LTSALRVVGSEWSGSRPGRYTPGMKPHSTHIFLHLWGGGGANTMFFGLCVCVCVFKTVIGTRFLSALFVIRCTSLALMFIYKGNKPVTADENPFLQS